ncbi:MAG TPA: 4-hydroxy-tetrahydrodipicolinate synthase [Egibacteraceae bacterium]|nr:4-hydroxy-tetrahydrodipicolinate synthase [Actinomycetota bacterium]HWB71029.1 4-hydroxy-tetrahydrodipicolinate synthase [Egibacteraceae bacterium]
MPSFGRVLTAMVSPMTTDRALDLDGAQRLAVHLVEHGNDGVVVAGTTGESPTLTHAETLDLFGAVVEAVGGHATVVAGCGKNDTAATIELTRQAAARGVDGIMVVTPYYNKPSQRGLEAHFLAVAAATELPVLLYNIPSRTACEIAPATLLRLAEAAPNIRGVKDAVGNYADAAWLAARAPSTFELWAGDDAALLPQLAVGGVGVVSVAGHLVGEDLARLVEVFPTDPGKARELYWRLLPLFKALFVDTNPVPVKAALGLAGLPAGPVRPPLADADDACVAAVRDALEALGVL